MEELQIALKDATGTTATFSTSTFTAPPVTGSAQDLDIPQTQINMASGLSWDLLKNIFFKIKVKSAPYLHTALDMDTHTQTQTDRVNS